MAKAEETLLSVYHMGEASSANARTIVQLLDLVVGICGKAEQEKYKAILEQSHKCRRMAYSLLGELGNLTMMAEDE